MSDENITTPRHHLSPINHKKKKEKTHKDYNKMRGKSILPVDPRPSRADPEARRLRKELEKEHGYEWIPPIVLGLIGITLAWDVAKDVSKCEERKEQEEKYQQGKRNDEREQRRRGERGGGRERDLGRRRPDKYDDEDDERRYDAAERGEDGHDGYDDDARHYEQLRRAARSSRRSPADPDLDRASRLERGEVVPRGGGRRGEVDEYRRRHRSLAYEDYYYDDHDPRLGGREQQQEEGEYNEYDQYDDKRGRKYEDRRSRPRPRRRSSDW